jgi:MtrB/PioB family decaheme-associated outer membrane protein
VSHQEIALKRHPLSRQQRACSHGAQFVLGLLSTLPAFAQTPTQLATQTAAQSSTQSAAQTSAQTADPSEARADPAWKELALPQSSVELGVGAASSYTAKANEYNGRYSRGPYLFGNVDLRGGGAYDSDDNTRWRVSGTHLGSRSPSLELAYGVQGSYRVKLSLDELWRNQSGSYWTPYQGVGSNNLSLPANWLPVVVPRVNATTPNARGLSPEVTASGVLVAGVLTPPTAAQASAAARMQAADLPAFAQVDLFSKRLRYGLAWEQQLGSQWAFAAAASREHKSGLKALGAQSRATDGDTSSILPTLIDQDDNKFNLGLSYTGEAAHLQLAYEDSLFINNAPSVTWALWGAPQITATLATAPSNRLRKLWFSAGFKFGAATSITAGASLSRGTQNDAFLADTTALLVPVNSAQAVVAQESVNLKLMHKASTDLGLTAGYKYELRENKTPVNVYGYYDNNNSPTGTSPFAYLYPQLKGLGQNFNFNANTPYSKRLNQVELAANYQLAPQQKLNVVWQTQAVDRYCKGSWINCADAVQSTEHSLRADWLAELTEDFSARLSLSSARRKVAYDENAFLAVVPMAGQSPSTATGANTGSSAYSTMLALGLTGYGPIAGLTPVAPAGSALAFYFTNNNALNNLLYGNENRISELVGMRRHDQSDRNRDKLRSSIQWQLSELLGVQAGLDVNSDHHANSVYGLQRVGSWAFNLDGTYAANDTLSVSVFSSVEDQRTRSAGNTYTANSTATAVNGVTAIDGGCFATIALRNANNKIDPCLDWTATTRDRTLTLGATAALNKLLSGKLDLSASAVFSQARTNVDVTGGSYANNPFAGIAGADSRAIAAYYIAASALPTNKVDSLALNLAASVRLDAQQALRFAYGYQHLRSSDWRYDGLQDGGLTQVLPTREQAPNHHVHRFGVSYALGF